MNLPQAIWVESCGSTNDLARTYAEQGAPAGTVVAAATQTQGRGRMGHAWLSPQGGLYLSMIARIDDRALWTWAPLAAGVAVARAVESSPGRLLLKWPNDLVVRSGVSGAIAKLGGILCESTSDFLIIGVGLNVAHAPSLDSTKAGYASVCLRDLGFTATVESVRESVVLALRSQFADIRAGSLHAIRSSYLERALFVEGSPVVWMDTEGVQHKAQVQRLGSHGELRVREQDGSERALFTEDVRICRPWA